MYRNAEVGEQEIASMHINDHLEVLCAFLVHNGSEIQDEIDPVYQKK